VLEECVELATLVLCVVVTTGGGGATDVLCAGAVKDELAAVWVDVWEVCVVWTGLGGVRTTNTVLARTAGSPASVTTRRWRPGAIPRRVRWLGPGRA
jgi:hypothetical protein